MGMQGIRMGMMGMRGIRVGMWGTVVAMRGIRVGIRGTRVRIFVGVKMMTINMERGKDKWECAHL